MLNICEIQMDVNFVLNVVHVVYGVLKDSYNIWIRISMYK